MTLRGYKPSRYAQGVGQIGPGTTRASALGAFSRDTWVIAVHWYVGRPGANASGGASIYAMSGDDLGARLYSTGAQAVTAFMAPDDATGGKLITTPVTNLMLSGGQGIAGAIFNAGATSMTYGQDNSGQILYYSLQTNPNPWVEQKREAQGRIHVAIEGVDNSRPDQPRVMAPASNSIVTDTTPTILIGFNDPDETYGDFVESVEVEVWDATNENRLLPVIVEPVTSGDRLVGFTGVTLPSLAQGQLIRLRVRVFDRFGEPSAVRHHAFTIASAGSYVDITTGFVPGVNQDGHEVTTSDAPTLLATWDHDTSLASTSTEVRIVKDADGSVYRGPYTDLADIADGNPFAFDFSEPTPDWAPLAADGTVLRYEIRGTDTAGVTSGWSTSATFVVNGEPMVDEKSPPNAIFTATPPAFTATIIDGIDTPETMRDMRFEIEHIASTNTLEVEAIWQPSEEQWVVSMATNQQAAMDAFFTANGLGDYRWRVLGEDPWGEPLADTYRTFTLANPPQITVTTPFDGGTVPTGAPPIIVAVDTTINAYRVTLYDALRNTQVHDSGQQSAAASGFTYNVPAGSLRNKRQYRNVVWVRASNGLENTVETTFTVDYVAPPMLANVTAIAVQSSDYDRAQPEYPEQRPNVAASWTRLPDSVVAPADFRHYTAIRISDDGRHKQWVMENRETTSFVDTTPGHGIHHYYFGYVSRINNGLDEIESVFAKVTVPITIRHSTLTSDNPDNPAVTLPFWRTRGVNPITDIKLFPVFGQKAPVAFQGELDYDVIDGEFQILDDRSGGDVFSAIDLVEDLRTLKGPDPLSPAEVIANVLARLVGGPTVGPRPRVMTYRDPHGRVVPVVITAGPNEIDDHLNDRATFRLQMTEVAAPDPALVTEPTDDVVDVTAGYPPQPTLLLPLEDDLHGQDQNGTVVVSVTGPAHFTPSPTDEPTTIVHVVGDIHVGYPNTIETRLPLVLPDFQALNDEIDHRIYVGDIINTAETTAQEDFAKAWIPSAGPTGRWSIVPGNHDYNGSYNGDEWAALWGFPYHSSIVDLPHARLINMGFAALGPGSAWITLSPEDLDYLDAALSGTENDCLITCHAPLANTVTTGSFSSTTPEFHMHPDAAIRAILDAHDNALVWLSGHTHTPITDPNMVETVDVGSRYILHLNASSIAHVPDVSPDPYYAPVVTITPSTIIVRWRDHETGTWLDQYQRTVARW